MTDKLDNPILDQPNISPNSAYYRTKSAKIKSVATADDNIILTEPSSPTFPNPQYNRITVHQDGGVTERDSTPGAERYCEYHSAGHYVEMSKNGQVTKIFGKDFEIILDDKNLIVSGNLNITVQGNANLLVAGNCLTKIKGNQETRVEGNVKTYIKGTYDVICEKDVSFETLGNLTTKSKLNMMTYSEGTFDIIAKQSLQIETFQDFNTKSAGLTELYATGTLYVDSAIAVQWNLPGTTPTSHAKPISKDFKFGLGFSKSLIEPSKLEQFLAKSPSTSTLSLTDTTIDYPKSRKPAP